MRPTPGGCIIVSGVRVARRLRVHGTGMPLLADAHCREIRNLTVSRNRCTALIAGVFPNRMLAALAYKPAAVTAQVVEQVFALHAVALTADFDGTTDT